MARSSWWIGAVVVGLSAVALRAQTITSTDAPRSLLSFSVPPVPDLLDGNTDASATPDAPKLLTVAPAESDTAYAPPSPPREEEGVNNGGVNVEFDFSYLTDYVYRGVSHNQAVGGNRHAANFQAAAELTFNLGKLPHPYVGVFSNVNDSDPVSRFQEILPYFGAEYTLRPVIMKVGLNSYLYPEREQLNPSPNTSEVYFKFTLDDSYFFLTPQPILSPYIFAAYDYQRNKGWYIEMGLKHDFIFEDWGFTLSPFADVAYISNFAQQFILVGTQDSGFQHYDVGLIGSFGVSNFFKMPPRYGQFLLQGYLTYTGRFSNQTLANTELWGGVGLVFKY